MSALFLLILALFVVVVVQLVQARGRMEAAQARAEASAKRADELAKRAEQEAEKAKAFEQYIQVHVSGYELVIKGLGEIESKLQAQGIRAEVNRETGEVIIKDEGLFFEKNQSVLTKKAKEFLDGFIQVYGAVVLSDEFDSEIRWIVVEGHTSSEGEDLHNLNLSLDRAKAVIHYLFDKNQAGQPHLSPVYHDRLKSKLVAAGRGEFGASSEVDARDRTVRFRLHFKGDILEIWRNRFLIREGETPR
ncbi:OmpA family protein [Myxococcota bacterium]|nr:OmpA family protein [Myxococcota bacterium]